MQWNLDLSPRWESTAEHGAIDVCLKLTERKNHRFNNLFIVINLPFQPQDYLPTQAIAVCLTLAIHARIVNDSD